MNRRIAFRLMCAVGATLLWAAAAGRAGAAAPPDGRRDSSASTDGTAGRYKTKTAGPYRPFRHRLGAAGEWLRILPTNVFIHGENARGRTLRRSHAARLEYAFGLDPHSSAGRAYGAPWTGLGIVHYGFEDRPELGQGWGAYLYQGAQLVAFTPRLSLDYGWRFGLTGGWHPYDAERNPYNRSHGSRLNAYLDAGLELRWAAAPRFDVILGATFAHFSNGGTTIPNAGLNTFGARLGLSYRFETRDFAPDAATAPAGIPPFRRHWSYDLVAFGSWRQRGYVRNGQKYVLPSKYAVAGLSIAPMRNLGYRFRVGMALDAVYDASANRVRFYADREGILAVPDVPLRHQLALGLSGRAEYVMPWFILGAGIGYNVLSVGGDMRNFYQILTLKIDLTHSVFLHVGYNLRNFHEPNYLMLGLGYRFHDLTPRLYRLFPSRKPKR